MDLRTQLEAFEGRKYRAYPDPLTHAAPWTIGVGHTGPDVAETTVWTDDQIDAALAEDIDVATTACQEHFSRWFSAMNEPRQAVLVGMCFQLGISRLLAFHQTLSAMAQGQWELAAGGMLDSLWARQTWRRANILARQMARGEWQDPNAKS